MSKSRATIVRGLLWFSVLITLIPIAAHLRLSIYNRPLWDDFCLTFDARRMGIIGHIAYHYNNWTGTYASTFIQDVMGLGHLWQFTPVLLLILWLTALIWLIYPLTKQAFGQFTVPALYLPLTVMTAAFLLSITVNGTVNVYQSLYWTSGAVTYSLPLILLTFNLGIFVRLVTQIRDESSASSCFVLNAVLALLAAGFSPLFAVAQVSLWICVLVGCAIFVPPVRRQSAIRAAVLAIIFSLIGLVILLLAPGNTIRQSYFVQSKSFIERIVDSVIYAALYPLRAGYVFPGLLSGAVLGGVIYTLNRRFVSGRRLFLGIAYLFGVMLILNMAAFFSSFFAISKLPPARAYIVIQYSIMVSIFIIGILIGYRSGQWFTKVSMQGPQNSKTLAVLARVGFIMIVSGLLLSVMQMTALTLNDLVALRTFAAEWDAIDRELALADSKDDITLRPFTYDFYVMADHEQIGTNPERNLCMRDYYGVRSIRMM